MKTCSHCGSEDHDNTGGRCRACYVYHRRTGRERPEHLLNPKMVFPCRECGVPLKPRGGAYGYCWHCYQIASRALREAAGW
jgi:hypothetical protein